MKTCSLCEHSYRDPNNDGLVCRQSPDGFEMSVGPNDMACPFFKENKTIPQPNDPEFLKRLQAISDELADAIDALDPFTVANDDIFSLHRVNGNLQELIDGAVEAWNDCNARRLQEETK